MYYSKICDKDGRVNTCVVHLRQIDIEDMMSDTPLGHAKLKNMIVNAVMSKHFKYSFDVDDSYLDKCAEFKKFFYNKINGIDIFNIFELPEPNKTMFEL